MRPILALVLSLTAAPAPAAESVTLLRRRIVESVEPAERAKAWVALRETAPATAQDLAGLFDLYTRHSDGRSRRAVLDSLARMEPNPALGPIFLEHLRQAEPESKIFGLNGLRRVREPSALKLVRGLADKKLKAPRPEALAILGERNDWRVQFEAISLLAEWEGAKARALVNRRAEESPLVGEILGRAYWAEVLPELAKWCSGDDTLARERCRRAAAAPIPPAAARATRPAMLAILKDAAADPELRHQLALKVGASADDGEVAELLAAHDTATEEKERLLWAAAAFASMNPKTAPLLARFARAGATEAARQGARAQLETMVGAERAAALIDAEKVDNK